MVDPSAEIGAGVASDAPLGSGPIALRGPVAAGVRWGLANQVVQHLTRFGVNVVLTRLLAPSAFGVMAVAFVVVNLGSLLTGVGFGQALIQRKSITARHVSSALGGSLVLGIAMTALVYLAAPSVGRFFAEPEVEPVLRALSLVFLFKSVEGVPNSMLRRNLRFREYIVSSSVAVVLGAGAGITVAVVSGGVEALVAYALAEAFVATALGWALAVRARVWHPTISLHAREIRDLAGYSGAVTGSRLLRFAGTNLDNVLIGRVLGATPLGYYALAYRIVLFPIQSFAEVVWSVALPAFSRVQDEPERAREAFLRAVRYLSLVAVPTCLVTGALADVAIPIIFGERWTPAARTVQVLALSGPAVAMMRLNGTLLESRGRATAAMLLTGLPVAMLLPAFAITVHHGVEAVAAGVTAVSYLALVPSLAVVRSVIGVSLRDQVANVATPVLAALAAVATVTLVRRIALDGIGVTHLVGLVGLAVVMYIGATITISPALLPTALHDLRGRSR